MKIKKLAKAKVKNPTSSLLNYPTHFGPNPIRANITLESTKGTPAIAGMIAHLLIEAGATVVLRDSRISIPSKKPNLKGLEVNLGRLVWIREEEADKWDKQ